VHNLPQGYVLCCTCGERVAGLGDLLRGCPAPHPVLLPREILRTNKARRAEQDQKQRRSTNAEEIVHGPSPLKLLCTTPN
jgi:hypothetical protein